MIHIGSRTASQYDANTPTQLPPRILSPEIEVVRKRRLSLCIVSFGVRTLGTRLWASKLNRDRKRSEVGHLVIQPLQLVLHYSRVCPSEGCSFEVAHWDIHS